MQAATMRNYEQLSKMRAHDSWSILRQARKHASMHAQTHRRTDAQTHRRTDAQTDRRTARAHAHFSRESGETSSAAEVRIYPRGLSAEPPARSRRRS
eukprot:4281996-Alexandrium_andersonii.AAC.1